MKPHIFCGSELPDIIVTEYHMYFGLKIQIQIQIQVIYYSEQPVHIQYNHLHSHRTISSGGRFAITMLE